MRLNRHMAKLPQGFFTLFYLFSSALLGLLCGMGFPLVVCSGAALDCCARLLIAVASLAEEQRP